MACAVWHIPGDDLLVLTAWVNSDRELRYQHLDTTRCRRLQDGQEHGWPTLNNAVGWMGRQWNCPYIRHFHDLGYPFRDYNDSS